MKNENMPQDDELRDETPETAEDMTEEEISDEELTSETEESEDTEAEEEEIEEDSSEDDESEYESSDDEDNEESSDEDNEETEESDSSEDGQPAKKKKRSRADTRKLRYGSMATALTAVVVAVVILLNVICGILYDRYPLTVDLTSDQLYTLSDESKEVASSITKDVEIVIFTDESFFSSPSLGYDEANTALKQFYEETKQYSTLSGGKVTTSFVDLDTDPTLATQYSDYDVEAGSILFLCGTRGKVISYSDLFTYSYDSSYELTDFESCAEQQMASGITAVSSDKTNVLTVLTGHDEDSDTITGIESVLDVNNYSAEELDITASEDFNEDSNIALIAAPSTDYSTDELDRLSTWLDNDGTLDRSLIVVINYEADCPNLYEFLNVEYGIEVTDNLILETSSSRIYNYRAYYPYGDIETSDYTEDLDGSKVLMPVCRQLLTNWDSDTDNSEFNIDIVTFPETAQINPLSDALNSVSDNQTDADEYPIVGTAYATKWLYDDDNVAHSTNVLVSGCYMMFNESVLSMTSVKNEKLLIDLANGFTGNEDSISISTQSLEQDELEFTTAQINIFWLIFVLFIPIALLVASLIVFLRRRRL